MAGFLRKADTISKDNHVDGSMRAINNSKRRLRQTHINKQVLPHILSPTMTRPRRISAMAHLRDWKIEWWKNQR